MQATPEDVLRALAAAGVNDAVRFSQRDTTTISARARDRTLTAVYYERQSARRHIKVMDARGKETFDYTREGVALAVERLLWR